MLIQPPHPTTELVLAEAASFDSDRDVALVEASLGSLFRQYPCNTRPEDVLPKVATLNALYSTNIYALSNLTRLIVAADIDPLLDAGSCRAVEAISVLEAGGKSRRIYSFATKYCSWHQPDLYPIFDSAVERALAHYKRKDSFASFTYDDLRNYERFVAVLEVFRSHYGLRSVSFKALDKFLWKQGQPQGT